MLNEKVAFKMKAMFMLCINIGLLVVKKCFLCMNYEKEICNKGLFLVEKERKRRREKERKRAREMKLEGGRVVLEGG